MFKSKWTLLCLVGITLVLVFSACGGADTTDTTGSVGEGDAEKDSNEQIGSNEQESEELVKVDLRLNWTFYGEHAPFFVAYDKGYYEDEGLEVEILESDGSGAALKLIGNKSNTIGYVDYATLVHAVTEGIPVKGIANYIQVNPMAIIFPAEKNIQTPDDLIGKSIALTQGDSISQVISALYEINDIPEGEVKHVSVGTPAAKEAAMLQGQVDGLTGYYFEQAARIEANEDIEMDYLRFTDFGITLLNMGLVAHHDTIESDPELLTKFINATNNGWKDTINNPEEAAEIFSKHVPVFSKELAFAQINEMIHLVQTENSEGKTFGWMAPADWEASIELLQEYGGLEGSTDINDYFTNDLIPE